MAVTKESHQTTEIDPSKHDFPVYEVTTGKYVRGGHPDEPEKLTFMQVTKLGNQTYFAGAPLPEGNAVTPANAAADALFRNSMR